VTAALASIGCRIHSSEDVSAKKPTALLPRQPIPVGDRLYQVLVCTALGGVSKFIMQVLNHTEFIDTHKLLDVLDAPDRQRVRSCDTIGMQDGSDGMLGRTGCFDRV
jgi:hypothetical protein